MGTQVTIGQYDYTLDAKNRLVVPPSYREALVRENGSHFFVTTALGDEPCLWFFLPSQWEQLLESFNQQTAHIKDKSHVRGLRVKMFGSAAQAPVDDQGRILIPHNLKEYAKLKRDVVIVGAGNKAEIWDEAKFQKFTKTKAEPAMAKLAKELDL